MGMRYRHRQRPIRALRAVGMVRVLNHAFLLSFFVMLRSMSVRDARDGGGGEPAAAATFTCAYFNSHFTAH